MSDDKNRKKEIEHIKYLIIEISALLIVRKVIFKEPDYNRMFKTICDIVYYDSGIVILEKYFGIDRNISIILLIFYLMIFGTYTNLKKIKNNKNSSKNSKNNKYKNRMIGHYMLKIAILYITRRIFFTNKENIQALEYITSFTKYDIIIEYVSMISNYIGAGDVLTSFVFLYLILN